MFNIILIFLDSRDVVLRSAENDVLTIPDSVWDAEKNWTLAHPDDGQDMVRQIGNDLTPPTQACLTVKVIYNNAWVQSSAGGNAATAQVRAQEVVNEAQNIYNAKYASANRLGTVVTFNLVGGGKFK